MSGSSKVYKLKNVGERIDPCGMPFLIVLVLLRSPPSSTVKLFGPVKGFKQFYSLFAFDNFD